MVCRQRPEPPALGRSGARRPPRARALGLIPGVLLVCIASAFSPAPCDERVVVGGLADTEIWKTDEASRLLSRNEGDAAPGGRLRLWAIAQFRDRLQGFAMGEVEGGRANGEGETETELEQAYVRYTFRAPARLVVEAGQMVTPIGNFSRRYLSSVNPLIGSPDSYSLSYPLGLQVIGQASRFDYRVALVDRPFVNDAYVPQTGRALRPALAAGVTPFVGTRLGAYVTRGPYLGPASGPFLTPGDQWKDFGQSIYGFDLQFSRGYFELNGDFARSSYEAPGGRTLRGVAYFIEPKYTWSPRFFTALRVERNDYPYISPLGPGIWIEAVTDLYNAELGAGFRFGPGTILKVGYRRDRWMVPPAQKSFFPDGYSISAQLSCTFNLNSWVERPK